MQPGVTIEKKTVQDYQQLPERAPYQLINGKLVFSATPNRQHQKLLGEIFLRVSSHCDNTEKGEVYIGPFDGYLDDENVLKPDICFISQNNIFILTEAGVDGAPDLIIELRFPSNAYYDLRAKFQLYEKYGVKEYFIVDPEDNMVIAYKLIEGSYKELYREYKKIESAELETLISW